MAAAISHVCAKCRQKIENGWTELEIVSGSLRNRRGSLELCKPCMESLEQWLSGSALTDKPAETVKATHEAAG